MPKYEYAREPKREDIVAEKIITRHEAARLLGVDPDEVYFRVVHEMTKERPPWAIARIQAVRKG